MVSELHNAVKYQLKCKNPMQNITPATKSCAKRICEITRQDKVIYLVNCVKKPFITVAVNILGPVKTPHFTNNVCRRLFTPSCNGRCYLQGC